MVSVLPGGWSSTRNRSPSVDDFQVSASAPHSFPHALLSTNATIAQWVTTPLIGFDGLEPRRLSFYLRRSATHTARLVVEVSTDGGEDFPEMLGEPLHASGETSYLPVEIPLPAGLAGRMPVRFRWRILPDSAGASGTLRLDDIQVTGAASRDLALEAIRILDCPSSHASRIRAELTIRNTGTLEAEGSFVRVSLDSNRDTLAGPEEFLADVAFPTPLAAGDSAAAVVEFAAPEPGEWYLLGEIQYAADQVPANNRSYARFTVPYPRGAVVINEVMYAPIDGEPEWVELSNLTGDTLSCGGWTIRDAGEGSGAMPLAGECPIHPGEFLVLTRDSLALVRLHPGVVGRVRAIAGFPSLNNSGDAITVRDGAGNVIDSVRYEPIWGGGSGGRSLERRDVFCCSGDPANWGSSRDLSRSTPGLQNSIATLDSDLAVARIDVRDVLPGEAAVIMAQILNVGRTTCISYVTKLYDTEAGDSTGVGGGYVGMTPAPALLGPGDSAAVRVVWEHPLPGSRRMFVVVEGDGDRRAWNDSLMFSVRVGFPERSLVINEIMSSPMPGDPEYVELFNPGPASVDLRGWTVADMSSVSTQGGGFLLCRDRSLVPPGGFALLASDSGLLSRYPELQVQASCEVSIVGRASLGLNNAGDLVILRDPSGCTIDSVRYSSDWHTPGLSDPTGRSLERIHPALASDDRRTWSSCVAVSGGTPGRVNSVYAEFVPPVSALLCIPNPFSPDGDGHEDATIVTYRLPLRRGMMDVRIFDIRGRMVRWLVNNEPCASQGGVVWDGRDGQGRKVRIGIYVILLRFWGDSGEESGVKGLVVVGGKL
jgi:Lamin Tail Domain